MSQTELPANSSFPEASVDDALFDTSGLKKASRCIFFGGIGFTLSGLHSALTNEGSSGHMIFLTGLGIAVAGLTVWAMIDILTKPLNSDEV